MQKSTLIEIIRSLDKKEVREIHKWLLSPAHNHREDGVLLFQYLVKALAKNEAAPEKEQCWDAIFQGKPYDDAYMRQVMYFLLQNIEEYLAFTELSKDDVHIQSVLLKVYHTRKLDRSFRLTMENARKRQQKSPFRNAIYLKEQHLLEQEQYYYLVGQKWSTDLNLQETSNALDLAYIAEKLRLGCLMLAHQNIYKKITYQPGFLPLLLEYVENNGLLSEPAVAMYYYSYKALIERENESNFDAFIKTIFEKGHLFPLNELREFYLSAINFCISWVNTGNIPYTRKAFELFRTGFEKGILLENNSISRMSFGNAVSAAIKIGEFDWAEQFIEKFKDHLEEKIRESMVYFNLARMHFEKGNYTKAQELLLHFEYDDLLLNIIAKTMLLKIYYEQDEYDAFESLIDSMRIYLQRKEALDPTRKNSFKNMLSLMKKMLHLDLYNRKQREEFAELVRNTNPLAEREWLLKQAAGK